MGKALALARKARVPCDHSGGSRGQRRGRRQKYRTMANKEKSVTTGHQPPLRDAADAHLPREVVTTLWSRADSVRVRGSAHLAVRRPAHVPRRRDTAIDDEATPAVSAANGLNPFIDVSGTLFMSGPVVLLGSRARLRSRSTWPRLVMTRTCRSWTRTRTPTWRLLLGRVAQTSAGYRGS
jgi:hypothetical protein